jgi:AcrR family transcriptional regulator
VIPDLALGDDIFSSSNLSTKMKIMHAVDKSLDKISVAEICENAQISRQTFYRHFKSKYDIPWWFSIFCRQFYLDEIGRTIDWKTGYYHHIRLILGERDFFRKSIQYSINTPFGQTILPEHRKTILIDTLENYRHIPIDTNMRFIIETFSKLECEVLNDWCRSDEPADLNKWTTNLLSLVPDRLYRALDIESTQGKVAP